MGLPLLECIPDLIVRTLGFFITIHIPSGPEVNLSSIIITVECPHNITNLLYDTC